MKKSFLSNMIQAGIVVFLVIGHLAVCTARGKGIKAGEGRLHPSIDLELVYDTNVGYFTNSEDGVPDMLLRVRPGLTLSFPSEMIEFELTGKFGYDYYFGIDQGTTTDLSTVAGDGSLRMGVNPKGRIRFFIEDDFVRSGDPRYSTLSGRFDRTSNEARARLQWEPGGGALIFDMAYGFFFDLFDESDAYPDTTALSSYSHRLYFIGRWKFLPKTAVILSVDSDLRHYPNSYEAGDLNGYRNVDINGLRATLGLLGQITPTIAVSIKAGYGNTLIPGDYEVGPGTTYSGDNFSSVIGQAEVTYKSGTTFAQGGYVRGFQPVVMFAYFGNDQVYARFKQQIAGRFTAFADIDFEWLSYGTGLDGVMNNDSDGLLHGLVGLEYHFKEWIKAGLRYQLEQRITDREFSPGNKADYTKHIFILQVGVDY